MPRSRANRKPKWYQERRRRYARFLRRNGFSIRAIEYRLKKRYSRGSHVSAETISDWTQGVLPRAPAAHDIPSHGRRSSIRFLRRYVYVLRRHGLGAQAIFQRLGRLYDGSVDLDIDTIWKWIDPILPRRDEQLFGVVAEYRQVRDLRDRLYRTLTASVRYDLDPTSAVGLVSSYDKMLRLSLVLGGQADLLALGRLGKPGIDAVVKRIVRDFGDILCDLGLTDSQSLMESQKSIVQRMLINVPRWFDLPEIEEEIELCSG
jgi:hypothetical protein